MKFINDCYTKDKLKLPMIHYESLEKDICIVCVHGMCSNFLNNSFYHIWGEYVSNNNIGFIYFYNRGHDIENDMLREDSSICRCGTRYEIFEESIYDIDSAVDMAISLGYKRIILLGHSYGCNKVIYYMYKKKSNISGIILCSIPDMIGIHKLYENDYDKLLREAKCNIDNNDCDKLLSKLIEGYMYMSSKTYYNWYRDNSNLDNFPILNNSNNWYQFESIYVPILTFSGELEEEYYKDFNLIKEKACNAKSFSSYLIPNANHVYEGKEEYIAKIIYKWISEMV